MQLIQWESQSLPARNSHSTFVMRQRVYTPLELFAWQNESSQDDLVSRAVVWISPRFPAIARIVWRDQGGKGVVARPHVQLGSYDHDVEILIGRHLELELEALIALKDLMSDAQACTPYSQSFAWP